MDDPLKRPFPMIEMIDDQMAEIIRKKSGFERLMIANQMFIDTRRM